MRRVLGLLLILWAVAPENDEEMPTRTTDLWGIWGLAFGAIMLLCFIYGGK